MPANPAKASFAIRSVPNSIAIAGLAMAGTNIRIMGIINRGRVLMERFGSHSLHQTRSRRTARRIPLHVADEKVVGWTNKRGIASASCLSRIDIASSARL